jgi:GT2 family glycosyltransferase
VKPNVTALEASLTEWGAGLTKLGAGLAVLGTLHSLVNVALLRRPTLPPDSAADQLGPQVSLLVPARDEQDQLAGCLDSLRAQRYQGPLEIVVLDDDSRDRTAEIAAEAAAADRRVRVLSGQALPPGWLGKPYACAQLAAAAEPDSAVLVFVDADVRLAPDAVQATVALMTEADLDLASPYPTQLAITWSERLIQPLLQWSWLTLLPLRQAERSPRPSLAAANGQFLAVRRAAYQRAGGHAAIRDQVLDDVALVRAVKATGGRGGVVDGTRLAHCRMYRDWSELQAGYGKSLAATFDSGPAVAALLAGLGLAYVLPPLATLRGSPAGLIGTLAAIAGRVVTARATGGRAWPDAAAQPASIVTFGVLLLRSRRSARLGRLRWKGRPIPSRSG